MQRLRSKILYFPVLVFLAAAIAGCGNDESSATSGDKWLDAGGVELFYDAQIRMDAVNAGKSQFEADRSCAAMLPMAQKSLSDSSNVGMSVQVMYKTCNDAGLKFQNEVRCEANQMQVLCR